jgi:tape measure domain-containing protein
MSFNVADLVATLRVDKASFDRDVIGAGARVSELGKQSESTGAQMAGALSGGAKAAAVATVALGVASVNVLKNLLQTGIAYNTLQQTSRAALKTLMGGAQEANKQMDKLDVFAKTSPFSKSVFITAQQQLIGFGVSAQKVIPYLNAVQDATAAVGGSNQDISDISTILAQIAGAGKITGQDLLQLGQRGINAADLIGKSLGKTGPEIKASITKGTLDSTVALDALVKGMEVRFGGAAANVKQTMTGAADRVKSATRDIGSALAEPFVAHNGGGRLVQWTNDWADALRAIEKKTPAVVDLIMTRFSPAVAGVSVHIQNFKNAVKDFDLSKISNGLDTLQHNLPAVAALTGGIAALSGAVLADIPVIGKLVGGFNPLLTALIAAAAASPAVREALGDIFRAAEPLLPAITDLSSALSGALTSGLNAAVPLLHSGASIMGVLVGAVTPVIGAIADLVRGFSDLPAGVQTAVIAFGGFIAAKGPAEDALGGIGDSISGLVGKIKGGGLAGAVSGLLSVFGGPWGLALGAASAALGFFAQQQADTDQRVKDFTASLDQNTGAVTQNTAVVAGNKLKDYAGTLKDIHLNAKDAADAVSKGGPAFVDMQNKINALRQATLEYNTTQGQGGTVHEEAKKRLIDLAAQYNINADAATNLNSGALTQLLGGMSTMRTEVVDSSAAWQDANGKQAAVKPVTLALSDAIKKVGDSTANTSDRLQAYQDIIDAMNGKTKTAEQSSRDLSKTSRDLAGFFNEVDANGNKLNKTLAFNKDGSVAFNDAGDRLTGMLDSLAQKGQTAALAAADLAKSQGRGSQAASDADKALAPYRATLQDLANKGLISQKQVDALSKSLFGVPGKTTAVLTDDGSAPAVKLKVDELTRTILATPDKQVTITEPQSPAVIAKLKALGYVVTTLPNGTVQIAEKGAAAARAAAESVRTTVRLMDGSTATVYVVADTRQAMSDIERLKANSQIQANLYKTGGAYRAEGAVVDYYANGGLREHPALTPMSASLASIVPANSWRVIGDNMTAPELFAPLDGSARSIELMREGARRMGFNLVPEGATRYLADGGLLSNGSTGGGRGTATAAGIDYDRLAAAIGKQGDTYQFTVPDKATAQEFFDEAQYQARIRNRRGE